MLSPRIGVIMAGGSGERFWPLSRPNRPKQLLKLTHPELTMLEEAIGRLSPLVGAENILLSVSQPLLDPIRATGYVPESQILTEPAKRNTLGAMVWLAAVLESRGLSDVTIAVVTSDHRIGEPDTFRAAVDRALAVAEATEELVVMGVRPDRPETGYGYIELAEPEIPFGGSVACVRFREKPSVETARDFVSEGRFLWNSGMLFFTAQTLRQLIQRNQPEASRLVSEIATRLRSGEIYAATVAFEALPNISFDYAVLEREPNVRVVEADFPWDDVGAWDALERTYPSDQHENTVVGRALALDSHGCIVLNESADMKVALLGVEDLIVVTTADSVLVCPKSAAQRVREIVVAMAAQK